MIEWLEKNRFTIGDTRFRCMDMGLGEQQSTIEEFVFQKSVWMVERYAKLAAELKPKNIFEIGIWRGGSCVFFHQLCNANKLVTVDLATERITAVDQYIEARSLQDSLVPRYGIDQSDSERLRSIVREEFQENGLDLVMDDASHFLDETTSSFNALFPFVRPGGAYVVEDWPWAHGKVGLADDEPAFYPEREPLTILLFQLILACPSTHSYIDRVEIDRNSVTIWRGDGTIDPEGFDITQCSLARGRALIARPGQ